MLLKLLPDNLSLQYDVNCLNDAKRALRFVAAVAVLKIKDKHCNGSWTAGKKSPMCAN